MKKTTLLCLLLFCFLNTYTQIIASPEKFTYLIRDAIGDLNNDGRTDYATISMDTTDENRPLKLEIFFAEENKNLKRVFSSTETIEAMYPKRLNGEVNESNIPDLFIEEGKLILYFFINGNSLYDFKYKNGNFELINFSYVQWDGKNITETDFNLVTGKYSKISEILNTDEITLNIKKKEKIRPLPQLKNFKPFTNELF